MNELTNSLPFDFWAGWAAGITVLGLLGLAWLSWGVYRDKNSTPPDEVWDADDGDSSTDYALREGGAAPPKWWFFSLFAALIFSAGYVLLYPGLGDYSGALNWNQHRQLQSGMQYYQDKTAAVRAHWQSASFEELRSDRSAMQSARRLFANQCAACHGEDGRGQAGMFPNLTDDKWQWGGNDDNIMQSIAHGRTAVMPSWNSLGTQKINQLAEYLIALSTTDDAPSALKLPAAAKLYATNCAACHGTEGQGNTALGAPSFDGNWLYFNAGDDLIHAVQTSIRHGRGGIMPAQQSRLTTAQIRILTAWVGGGMTISEK